MLVQKVYHIIEVNLKNYRKIRRITAHFLALQNLIIDVYTLLL